KVLTELIQIPPEAIYSGTIPCTHGCIAICYRDTCFAEIRVVNTRVRKCIIPLHLKSFELVRSSQQERRQCPGSICQYILNQSGLILVEILIYTLSSGRFSSLNTQKCCCDRTLFCFDRTGNKSTHQRVVFS